MKEWSVPCEWCGSKIGEPCKTENGVAYNTLIHRPRAYQYDRENGLSTHDRGNVTYTPSEVNQIEGKNIFSVQRDETK